MPAAGMSYVYIQMLSVYACQPDNSVPLPSAHDVVTQHVAMQSR